MCLIVFAAMIRLNKVFYGLNDAFLRNAITGVVLNTSLNALLLFNICQCLMIISLVFDQIELYVTISGIAFFLTVLMSFNRLDLSRLQYTLKTYNLKT